MSEIWFLAATVLAVYTIEGANTNSLDPYVGVFRTFRNWVD